VRMFNRHIRLVAKYVPVRVLVLIR
jgi:hypothetical protein